MAGISEESFLSKNHEARAFAVNGVKVSGFVFKAIHRSFNKLRERTAFNGFVIGCGIDCEVIAQISRSFCSEPFT